MAPPQVIICEPVQTALGRRRPPGAPVTLVGDHAFRAGSYLPPSLKRTCGVPPGAGTQPPHTIISSPVHTAAWCERGAGAFAVGSAVHESADGTYRPPVLRSPVPPCPPQTIISFPVQTAECSERAVGSPETDIVVHRPATGSYAPPEPR